jgi:hypothetical protein
MRSFRFNHVLYNITYPDPAIKRKISAEVGKAYSILQRIAMRGNGSPKMRLIENSPFIEDQFMNEVDTRYGNIELRKNGILVGFQTVRRVFVYAIPYSNLQLSSADNFLRISDAENYFLFEPVQKSKIDHTFVQKLREQTSNHR